MAKLLLSAKDVPATVVSVSIGKANNYCTGVASKPLTRSKHVIRNLRVNQFSKALYIRSNIMEKKFGVWVRENGVLPIERTDDEDLFAAIKHFEDKVQDEVDIKLNCEGGGAVRPIYLTEKETAWIKLSLDFEAFAWDGKKIPSPFQFGTGSYQLVIRATNLYCGEHGSSDYKCSVMFKVCQIRYQEEKATCMFECSDSANDDNNKEDKTDEVDDDDADKMELVRSEEDAEPETKKRKKKATKSAVKVQHPGIPVRMSFVEPDGASKM